MKKSIYYCLGILSMIALCLARVSNPVWADDSEGASESEPVGQIVPPSAAALQISPVTTRILLESDKTVEKTFSVKNMGSDPFTFRVYATPYSSRGENYELDFETETDYTQISRWVTFLDEDESKVKDPTFSLDPGETKTITYYIDVPEDVPSGGQYASIFAETLTDDTSEGGIKTISRAGMILFGSIEGDTRRDVKIGDVGLDSFMFGGNVNVYADVENMGNIDLQASTNLTVKSIFGKELYNNSVISTVLPETTRKVYSEWSNTPFYGLFRLDYKVSALGTEVQSSRVILVMPPIILGATIVLFSSLIIAVLFYLKRKKEYSERSRNTG